MYRAIEQELPSVNEMIDRKNGNPTVTRACLPTRSPSRPRTSVTIDVHTVDHPLLTRCTHQEAYRQFADNRVWLERVSTESVRPSRIRR